MQLLMFSGNSLRNQDWIIEAESKLGDLVSSTYVQQYSHWSNGKQWIDLAEELAVLKAQNFEPEYGVFAKSIGTVLTVQAIALGIIKPKFLLLCGLPMDYIDEYYPEFADLLASFALPTVVIHNEHDKVGDAADAEAYMSPAKANPNFKFITTPGDTHDYLDYDLLRQQLRGVLAGV